MNSSDESSEQANKVTSKRVIWATFVIALGGLLFGYDSGVISGALPSMTKDFNLDAIHSGMVVSSLVVGAAIGALSAGRVSDRFGRRPVLIAASAIFVLGAIIAAFSPNVPVMIVARVILGLGVGTASNIVPVFISELAPAHIRGRLVSLNQLMIVTGIMIAYIANYALHGVSHDWRWMFGISIAPALLFGIGIITLSESPRWLVLDGQVDKARQVLQSVRESQNVEDELTEIKASIGGEQGNVGFRALGERRLRRVLIAGIGLQILGQLTGVNAVVFYAPTIFKGAGLGDSSAILATVGMGAINIVATFIGMALVDKIGRTRLLASGSFLMTIFLAGLAIDLAIGGQGTTSAIIGLICVFGYIAAVASTLNVVVFIIASELYPLSVRGTAMSLTIGVNWTMSFIVSLTFLSLFETFGGPGTFGVYALTSAVLGIFALKVIPETKGKTLEEIERDYAS